MARKKKARPSTDELPFADYAWKVLDEPVPGHLRAWGLAPGASFEDLEARWSDPQRVQRKLAELPPLAIAALEELFHAGGEAVANALASRMSRRLGAPIGQVALACDSLVDAGVVLAVRYTRSTSAQHRLLAVRPFADVALPLVRGVTAPREPVVPSDTTARTAPPEDIAVAGWACHVKVRSTKSGDPHRGALKKLAKRLSIAEDHLDAALISAVRRGMLRNAGGAFDVDFGAMQRCARGLGATTYDERFLCDGLSDGPRPALQVETSMAARHSSQAWGRPDPETCREEARARMAEVRELVRFEVDGQDWLAWASRPEGLPDRVEGFVTPNLDVMVGPDPDPRLVAVLSVAAELTQLDRVFTFRLRPETVAQAALRGIDGEHLVDALDRVGRHPLPDSVRAQVLDWAGSAKVARGQSMLAIRVPGRHAPGALTALRGLGEQVSEELFLVPVSDATRAAERLSKAGFACDLDLSPAPASGGAKSDARWANAANEPGAPYPAFPRPSPDEALRARVEADRAAGWAESWQEPPPDEDHDIWARLEALGRSLSGPARKALAILQAEHERHMPAIEAWLREHSSPEDAAGVLRQPSFVLTMLLIAPHHRGRLLRPGVALETVWGEAVELAATGKLSPAGRKIRKALDSSGLAGALALAFTDDVGDAPQTRLEIASCLSEHAGCDHTVTVAWMQRGVLELDEVWIDELRTRPDGKDIVLWTQAGDEVSRVVPLDAIRAVT